MTDSGAVGVANHTIREKGSHTPWLCTVPKDCGVDSTQTHIRLLLQVPPFQSLGDSKSPAVLSDNLEHANDVV